MSLKISPFALFSILLFQQPFTLVQSHSWLACADYYGSVYKFEEDKCRSYGRGFFKWGDPKKGSNLFGSFDAFADRGQSCAKPKSSDPRELTKARPGQVLCVAWPTKNHVATPDGKWSEGLQMEVVRADKGIINPTYEQMKQHPQENNFGLKQQNVAECTGFDRAPAYQVGVNQDKVLGTGCFRIDPKLQAGDYTFGLSIWQGKYLTCFDVRIEGSVDNSPVIPLKEFDTVVDKQSSSGDLCRKSWKKYQKWPLASAVPGTAKAKTELEADEQDEFQDVYDEAVNDYAVDGAAVYDAALNDEAMEDDAAVVSSALPVLSDSSLNSMSLPELEFILHQLKQGMHKLTSLTELQQQDEAEAQTMKVSQKNAAEVALQAETDYQQNF